MALNTTPKTWTGVLVTVSDLNTEIRDAFTNLQAAFTSYTPTLTNITLGNGTLSCGYTRIGHLVIGRVGFVAGSSTTYSAGQLLFSLPVTANTVYTSGSLNANLGVGDGMVSPAGSKEAVTVAINGSNQFQLVTNAGKAIVTNAVPGTFGTSGIIGFTFMYEAA